MQILETSLAGGVNPAVILLIALFFIFYVFLVILTRGKALKIFRIFLRRGRFVRFSHRTGARARSYVGSSGLAVFGRLFHPLTETEKALVTADFKARVSFKVAEQALKAFHRQGERDPNIDRVDLFRRRRDELWKRYKARKLKRERRRFFEANKAAIRAQLGRQGARFEDVDFHTLNYDKIGERIDEEYVLNREAFQRQKNLLGKKGMLFKEISTKPNYLGLSEDIDIENARRNYLYATDYFLYDVPVTVDEDLLYEDVNDASIVDMTGIADKDVFYFLTQMRKTVNRNVMYLSLLVTLVFSAFISVNYWISESIDFTRVPEIVKLMNQQDLGSARQVLNEAMGSNENGLAAAARSEGNFWAALNARVNSREFTDALVNKSAFAVLTFLIALAVTAFFYLNPYTHFQSQNRVHLKNFMTGYSALLVSYFTRAESQSRGSFSGDQSGPTARELGQIWFINMQWFAHRLLFVEIFLRSIIFQIKRNSGYYIVGIPFVILIPVIAICWALDPNFGSLFVTEAEPTQQAVNAIEWFILNFIFALLLLLLFQIFWWSFLRKCVQGLLNIDDADWQNFHKFDLQRHSAGLVRHFIAEIYNERNRWSKGAGGGGGNNSN